MNITWALSYTLVSVVTTAIIFMIYKHVTYDMGARKEIDTFRYVLIAFLTFTLCNGVCIWANHYNWGMVGTVFTVLNLSGLCAAAFFWFYYIEIRVNSHRVENRRSLFLMMAPMLAVILIIVSSPITHFVFYYDEEGRYCRGPAYSIILIAALVYLVIATVHTYRGRSRVKTNPERKQYHHLMAFIIFPFLAGVIDFIYAHLPSMELVVMFGIVLIYLNLQHAQIYRDDLTGLNNRRLTDEYLSEHITLVSEESPLYCFMADIDQFKMINDRFGHLEGDRALQLVADVLRRYTEVEHYYISRWGGDEFMMIVDDENDFDPDEFRRRLDEDMQKVAADNGLQYEVKLSMGCVRCVDPDMEVDTLIRLADKRMYADKSESA